MSLHQIEKVSGEIRRVPRGKTPVIELYVPKNARVVGVSLREGAWMHYADGRKTVDWVWEAFIDTDTAPFAPSRDETVRFDPMRVIGCG